MKTLQERMNDMKPYFRGIEMYNEALIVRVMLPPRWKAYNSNDGRIKATPSETVANEYFYYANSEDTSYEDIFDLIDIVLKMKLLRDKGEELKELFSRLSYEELTTLKFVTEKPKKEKAKRKYTKKKKEAEKEEEVPQNETNDDMEELLKDGE